MVPQAPMTASRRSTSRRSPLWLTALIALCFAGLIAVCAQVAFPFYPVAITLQTFAVLLAGALLGARGGVLTVLAYLAAAALGAPVLSGGAGGLSAMTGANAGYLVGFVLAALLAGWASDRGELRQTGKGMGLLLLAHAVILAMGVAWLVFKMDMAPQRAFEVGAIPYLVGAVVKSALVLASLWLIRQIAPRA